MAKNLKKKQIVSNGSCETCLIKFVVFNFFLILKLHVVIQYRFVQFKD